MESEKNKLFVKHLKSIEDCPITGNRKYFDYHILYGGGSKQMVTEGVAQMLVRSGIELITVDLTASEYESFFTKEMVVNLKKKADEKAIGWKDFVRNVLNESLK